MVNKDALLRYRIINNCLLNGKVKTKEELIKAIQDTIGREISDRTFAADIKAMREDEELGYLAPIVFDKEVKAYRYGDHKYSIDKIPISAEEIDALSFAASVFEQYKRIELFEKFSGAVDKLVDLVKIRRNATTEQLDQFIEFENAPLVKGTDFLEPIIAAIKAKNILQIEYQSFNRTAPKRHKIHPYYLKEYRNRWYLIGYDEEKSAILTLGLERIAAMTADKKITFEKQSFNAHTYFRNTLGVSVHNEHSIPEEIIIRFTPQQAMYLKTQPMHHSQEIVSENDQECIMRYLLCANYELKSYLLSLGTGCEVLQPANLRQSIKMIASEITALYD
jgi:predicted DNA-binding transcriptional regulator YafY